ncbi:MAG: undecaprenyl-diphosphate phosphatase [Oscillospiraceae bacterium]|nr:undecaprenyl-diphosphate phosphatase [Oscillospiraceae bacterium]
MDLIEIIKSIFFGIVQGITEWLPISSTGHMILLSEFVNLRQSDEFKEMFEVVIQLGSIMAVVVLYFKKLWPFSTRKSKESGGKIINMDIMTMWFKVLVACIPAAVIGLFFDDFLHSLFYNSVCVSIALIVVGILFIVLENKNKNARPRVKTIDEITYLDALIIGVCQVFAAVFPGTSRSGATIMGSLAIGIKREIAAEFTFFLAVPVMFGASLLKVVKFGLDFSGSQLAILAVAMITAFVTSLLVIRFLMGYIKKHDFKVFGWYRIVLGILVIGYFTLRNTVFA